ncbi:hypothetical protein YC2023_023976 [Brassica napus]
MDQCNSVATLVGAHFKLKTTTKHEIREHADQMEGITYQSVVGSIMYVMIGTRPDLAYKAGLVSRFTCNPIQEHWRAVKWVLRYIQGSLDTKLCYKRKGEFIVKGYCKSQLQQVGLAEELGFGQETVEILCNSPSTIALSKNVVLHERIKHVAQNLVSDSVLDLSRGLLKLQSTLEGFLILIGYEQKHGDWKFSSTENHQFVRIFVLRSNWELLQTKSPVNFAISGELGEM